jgi:hypothetical protein
MGSKWSASTTARAPSLNSTTHSRKPVRSLATGNGSQILALDWLKTRRENQKLSRERQEKELTQLNVVATAMGYNVEVLLHIVMQQILPHREQSHAAAAALRAVENNAAQLRAFGESMHSKFTHMTTRCPEPYFIELEYFKEIPFVLAKDPELLKLSGWMVNYTRALKDILSERNKRIDANVAEGLDIQALEEQIRIQAHIGDTEVINSLMLFEQFQAIKIMEGYKNVSGVRLKVVDPEPLDRVLRDLRRIAEFPPSEPES